MSDSATRAPDLDAIRRRRAGATSSLNHWHVENHWRDKWVFGNERVSVDDMGEADAAFHAHAPEDIDTLLAENTRLRSQLDATAQAHERDVVRIAHALGWTHEPPASVDEVVARAAALHAEALKARTENEGAQRLYRSEWEWREAFEKDAAQLLAERDAARRELAELQSFTEDMMGIAADTVAEVQSERDALTRGEDTPSLDAIRAHGGVWLWTGDGVIGTAWLSATDDGRVVSVGAGVRWTHTDFAAHHGGRRWWRVRADGTLA